MTASLSLPGKTFLVGEYLAISGGPSILLATDPRFVLREGGSGHPFAQASPAGKYFERHVDPSVGFEFEDPHAGLGGLGASSAQFALLYAWQNKMNLPPTDLMWSALLREYRTCAWNGEGSPPSGADIVAQLKGGICYFDGQKLETRGLGWNFPNLSFTLLRTGAKLATHEHLRKSADLLHGGFQNLMRETVVKALDAFNERDEKLLISAVRDYARCLESAELTAPATKELLKNLHAESWLIAAKGCGAMGADVVLVLHQKAHADDVVSWARAKAITICGSLTTLGRGLT